MLRWSPDISQPVFMWVQFGVIDSVAVFWTQPFVWNTGGAKVGGSCSLLISTLFLSTGPWYLWMTVTDTVIREVAYNTLFYLI